MWAIRMTRGTKLNSILIALNKRALRAVRIVGEAKERLVLADAERTLAEVKVPHSQGTRVLVVSQRAWAEHSALETTIAAALALRGADVSFFTCGGGLPICEVGRPGHASSALCALCAGYQHKFLGLLGLPVYSQLDLVSEEERAAADRAARSAGDFKTFSFNGLPVGELARISLSWYLRDARPRNNRKDRSIGRDFLATASIMALAAPRLLDLVKPDVVFALNGIFVEERIICETARRRGIRVVTYEGGQTFGSWFFTSSDLPACEHNIDDEWAKSADPSLNPDEEDELQAVLDKREAGTGVDGLGIDPSTFKIREAEELRSYVGLTVGERLITVFTNVDWDTGSLERQVAFDDQLHFIASVMEAAQGTENLRVVVRVHPSEKLFPSRTATERLVHELDALPDNLKIIGPSESVSSYGLMRLSDVVLVWTSTIGLEAAANGCPVVVGGRTHYGGKGFTWDVQDQSQLKHWIAEAPLRMSPAMRELARSYAHRFFCRTFIPFPPLESTEESTKFAFSDLSDLEEGKDPYVDLICDGILRDRPFVLPSRHPV
jgi:hypothetical protein